MDRSGCPRFSPSGRQFRRPRQRHGRRFLFRNFLSTIRCGRAWLDRVASPRRKDLGTFKDGDNARDMSGSLLFTEQLPKALEGNYRAVSPVDHVDRLICYHASNRFPLVSFGAVATSEALAGWRSDTIADALIVFIIVATIGLGFFLVKELNNRAKARVALAESEANFRLLAEYSSGMVSRIGRDHVRRYVSAACIRVLGYPPEEVTAALRSS